MEKRVILVTGTPGVGKTEIAKKLSQELNAEYINLTELAKIAHLELCLDKQRETKVIDELRMRRKIRTILEKSATSVIIDGHYAAAVAPAKLVGYVFVLRRNPLELKETLRKRGYSDAKQKENVSSEILDVCLVEAVQKQKAALVCEVDVSGKRPEETIIEISNILAGKSECRTGIVDWLGLLEKEDKISEYFEM
jgi:adenylate kinase